MNWERYRDFLGAMEKPTIIFHKDSDGVCSAALMYRYTSGNAFPNDGPGIDITENLLDIIKDSEDVIFVDLPVDQLDIAERLKDKNVFILDHHPPEKNLTAGSIIHANPRFEDKEAYLPASYLTWRLMGSEVKNVAWKAAVGVVGDHGVEDCKDLLDQVEEENPGILPDDRYSYRAVKESRIGMISDMVEASKVIKGAKGIKESYRVMKEASDPEDVLKTRLVDYYHTSQKRIERERSSFEKNAEYFPKTNAYLYGIKSRSSLVSDISTLVADEKKESIVIIYQKESYGMKLSARCQSGRVDVSEILKEAVGENGKAGGHPQAAGGFVKKGKEDVVLESLREKLENLG